MIYDHEDQEVDGIHIIPRQWAMEINEIKWNICLSVIYLGLITIGFILH
jgi:hypothetical protein